MGNTIPWAEASLAAGNFALVGPGGFMSSVGPDDPDHATLYPGQFLLAIYNGCSESYRIAGTKEELRTALRAWLDSLDDDAGRDGDAACPRRTLTAFLAHYGARLGDEEAGLDVINDGGRFLLVERHRALAGPDQPYWFSRHTSAQAAREYNASQDCAEDWAVDSIYELALDDEGAPAKEVTTAVCDAITGPIEEEPASDELPTRYTTISDAAEGDDQFQHRDQDYLELTKGEL